jgi:hypothetical protein
LRILNRILNEKIFGVREIYKVYLDMILGEDLKILYKELVSPAHPHETVLKRTLCRLRQKVYDEDLE